MSMRLFFSLEPYSNTLLKFDIHTNYGTIRIEQGVDYKILNEFFWNIVNSRISYFEKFQCLGSDNLEFQRICTDCAVHMKLLMS